MNQYGCLTDDWQAVSNSLNPMLTTIIKHWHTKPYEREWNRIFYEKISVLRVFVGRAFYLLDQILR
jgi:hypothetical protein